MKNQFEEEDYVIFYANELRKNPKYFKQQKMLIDSQIKSSKELFQKTFGIKNFNENARIYLRKLGILW